MTTDSDAIARITAIRAGNVVEWSDCFADNSGLAAD
jgi:hypothetical protein